MSTLLSILQKVSAADVKREPFPHVVIHEALPWEFYHRLKRMLPSPEAIRNGRPEGDNLRYDLGAAELLGMPLPASLHAFVAYHVDAQFFEEIWRVFGPSIMSAYPNFGAVNPKIGVRYETEEAPDIGLDCQIGINTPALTTGVVRGPHIDHHSELFAGLLYMPIEGDVGNGADLELHRPWGPVMIDRKRNVLTEVDVVGTVPYAPNTFIGFVNVPHAIHGVTPRRAGAPVRRLINFLAQVPNGLFNIKPMMRR